MSPFPFHRDRLCHADESWQVYSPPTTHASPSDLTTADQAPTPSVDLSALQEHLITQAPQLKCIELRLESCTKIHTVANCLPPAQEDTRGCFSDIADYVAALTLSQTFPQTYIFKVPFSNNEPTQLVMCLTSPHLPEFAQSTRITVQCTIDAEVIDDMQLIFLDRGHCEIPVHIRFSYREDLIATAEPILCVHPNLPLHKPR